MARKRNKDGFLSKSYNICVELNTLGVNYDLNPLIYDLYFTFPQTHNLRIIRLSPSHCIQFSYDL